MKRFIAATCALSTLVLFAIVLNTPLFVKPIRQSAPAPTAVPMSSTDIAADRPDTRNATSQAWRSSTESTVDGALLLVRNRVDGNPIANAECRHLELDSRTLGSPIATSDREGLLRIDHALLGKTGDLVVHAPGYGPELIKAPEPRSTTEVRMTPGAEVQVLVSDPTNKPVEGMAIALSRRVIPIESMSNWKQTFRSRGFGTFGISSDVSNLDGIAHVDGLSPGEYYLACLHPYHMAAGLDFDQALSIKPGINKINIEARPILAAVGRVNSVPEKPILYCTWDPLQNRVKGDHPLSAERALSVHKSRLRQRFSDAMIIDLGAPKDIERFALPLRSRATAIFSDYTTALAGELTYERIDQIERCQTLTIEPTASRELAKFTLRLHAGQRQIEADLTAFTRITADLPVSIPFKANARVNLPPGRIRIMTLCHSLKLLIGDIETTLDPTQDASHDIRLKDNIRKVSLAITPPSDAHPIFGTIFLTGPDRTMEIPTSQSPITLYLEEGAWTARCELQNYEITTFNFVVESSDNQSFQCKVSAL